MDRPKRRKLLVASVGVATVSYALLACGKNASQEHPPGNLAVYVPPPDAAPVMPEKPVTDGGGAKDGAG